MANTDHSFFPRRRGQSLPHGKCMHITYVMLITALKHLHSCHPTRNGPLFTFQNGRFLIRRDINNLLLSTTDGVANVSSHSLRIGAASTAAAAGCPKWLIQALGRWSSDCFREYIRIPRATIRKTSMILANFKTIDIERFDPDTLHTGSPESGQQK